MKTVPIDQAGRVVLPKEMRLRLHIRPGDRLEVEAGSDAIVLRPRRTALPRLVKHKDRMVWDSGGEPLALEHLEEALRRGRNERDARASGL